VDPVRIPSGILPGGGSILASFTAYMLEKKSSRDPESFGKGNLRGSRLRNPPTMRRLRLPLCRSSLSGYPPNVVLAMMAGAMMITESSGSKGHHQQSGPVLGVIVSMWVGNVILVLLNLPLVGIMGEAPFDSLPAALSRHSPFLPASDFTA